MLLWHIGGHTISFTQHALAADEGWTGVGLLERVQGATGDVMFVPVANWIGLTEVVPCGG